MTYTDLCSKILEILPYAQIEEDNQGQLIVYTNLKRYVQEDPELVEFEG